MSGQQTVERGWESNHQRLKKYQLDGDQETAIDGEWRLRDWDDHPNDPGWERGTYRYCHANFRSKVQEGDVVLDTVYPGNPVKTDPFIRSVLFVNEASGNELFFDEFIFLDGPACKGIPASGARGHKSLTQAESEGYLRQVEENDAYNEYTAGDKPESIPADLWEYMLSRAGTASDCPTCGSTCSSGDEATNGDGGCD